MLLFSEPLYLQKILPIPLTLCHSQLHKISHSVESTKYGIIGKEWMFVICVCCHTLIDFFILINTADIFITVLLVLWTINFCHFLLEWTPLKGNFPWHYNGIIIIIATPTHTKFNDNNCKKSWCPNRLDESLGQSAMHTTQHQDLNEIKK